jgi:hypothetical protein
MPPRIRSTKPISADPAEFSFEDVIMNSWVEDTDVYLRLDAVDLSYVAARSAEDLEAPRRLRGLRRS